MTLRVCTFNHTCKQLRLSVESSHTSHTRLPHFLSSLICPFQRGEVEYSLRAIPLGGYVAFPDEKDPNNKFKKGALFQLSSKHQFVCTSQRVGLIRGV